MKTEQKHKPQLGLHTSGPCIAVAGMPPGLRIGKRVMAEITALHVTDEQSQANAERLALCWNEHDTLVAQRDALLEIVKRFEWSEWSNGKWCCPECGRMQSPVGEHREANLATNTIGCSIRAAIALCEPME